MAFDSLSHTVLIESATGYREPGTGHSISTDLIINMPIPTELSDIYSLGLWRSEYGVLIQLCIWNSLCTACSKSATGKQTGAAAGVSIGLFAPEQNKKQIIICLHSSQNKQQI